MAAIMTTGPARGKRVWKWLALGYILALHLLVIILIAKTDFIPRVQVRLGLMEIPNLHLQNMLRYHFQMDDLVPDGGVIFLGDSITQALATAAVVPYATNYGIGMETTADLMNAIPLYESLTRAHAIVLTIGINDFVLGRTEGLHDRYRQILAALPSGPSLVWCAVMPAMRADIRPSAIREANRTIQDLCRTRPRCMFLDTWSMFVDSEGRIIPKYFLPDGVHLSANGYRRWIAALRQALDEISTSRLAEPIQPLQSHASPAMLP
jgi:lysophospholipase L1-like esterase